MGGFEVGLSEVRKAQSNYRQHNENHRQGEDDRHAAAVFCSKTVDDRNKEDYENRREPDPFFRHAKITHGRPTAHGGRYRKICDEQECAEDSKESALLSRRGVNAAAVRKMFADDDVVVPDQRSEKTDRDDNWKRSIAGRNEGQADHVCFARAPVPIEQSSGAFPVQVARPMNTGAFHLNSNESEGKQKHGPENNRSASIVANWKSWCSSGQCGAR